MAVRRIFPTLVAGLLAAGVLAGCGATEATAPPSGNGPKIVASTTWEAGIAKAAGADRVRVIVPGSVGHAPDYDPKPSDLAAVADADFVLYAPFESFAGRIKEAAGSKARLVEVNLDNGKDRLTAEVTRLAALFGTQQAAAAWNTAFDQEYRKLAGELRSAWPGGQQPTVVSQLFVAYAAELTGAAVVGTFGPHPVTASQLAELSGRKPQFVFDNAHMSTGTALPDAGAEQVMIVNYPGDDLDLLKVFRTNTRTIIGALG
ncbi:MAG: zinc ABC transporter substrate-binding protein [Kibdelosporangium sp.]